jgi:EF-P beta-lysylation protein EpmB
MRVPRGFARRMRRNDPRDPLLLQVLPQPQESIAIPGFDTDPVGDLDAVIDDGLIQKYDGRTLVIASGACGIHCRYCFRRHFPYDELKGHGSLLASLIRHLSENPSVSEVILSGGDPLSNKDIKINNILDIIDNFYSVSRVRIHSRLPVVVPARVTDNLIGFLARPRSAKLVMVLHINHPREIDTGVHRAISRLALSGMTLLNQAVLLKGINDSAQTQQALSEACFSAGILPYYLHMLDPVAGAGHFAVSVAQARRIHAEMRRRLPGYLVPRLVHEVRGAPSKQPVCE